MREKAQGLAPEAERVKEKLRARHPAETQQSVDTEFGRLTVEDTAGKRAAPHSRRSRKRKA